MLWGYADTNVQDMPTKHGLLRREKLATGHVRGPYRISPNDFLLGSELSAVSRAVDQCNVICERTELLLYTVSLFWNDLRGP